MAEEKEKNTKQEEKKDSKKPPFTPPDFKNFKNPKNSGNNIWIYVVLLVVFAIFSFMDFSGSAKKISSTEFDAKLRNGEIEKVVVVNREYQLRPDLKFGFAYLTILVAPLDIVEFAPGAPDIISHNNLHSKDF